MALYDIQTKAEFKAHLESGRPVLVDFWAVWCPPCIAMAPVLEGVAQKATSADILKVNIEETPENAELANEYGVRSIPNMKLFKDGALIEEYVGVTPSSVLIEALEKQR